MITDENHLHDIDLLKKVVESIFVDIKTKYNFRNFKGSFFDSDDSIYMAIEKNELIFYIFISKREAYELCFLKKGEEDWKRKTFNTLISKVYPLFSEERAAFFKQQYNNTLKFEKYSYNWYYSFISEEIKFIHKHFPDMFMI